MANEAPSRARQLIQQDDVLVSTVRPNLNAVASVPNDLAGEIASTGFCVLRADPTQLYARYLYYFVQTGAFIASLLQNIRGVNYPAVTDSNVKAAPIPLPPLSEQHRIAEILDKAHVLRKKRVEINSKAERILSALFNNTFGDPATNPKQWPTGLLESVITETQYGISTKAESDESGVPIIRMNNIDTRGGLILSNLKHLNLDQETFEKYRLTRGDILFNRTNSRELVGKTGLWKGEIEAVFASYLIRVRTKPDVVPEFVWAYMNSQFVKKHLLNKARRAIGMANINAKELGSIPIIIPSMPLQLRFARHVINLEWQSETLRSADAAIKHLFEQLMHQAFSGRLTAKWREARREELLSEIERQARTLNFTVPSEDEISL